MADLNSFVTLSSSEALTSAADINDSGWILATGSNNRSYLISPLVVPVPEPETYALMLAGLGMVGLASNFRKRG